MANYSVGTLLASLNDTAVQNVVVGDTVTGTFSTAAGDFPIVRTQIFGCSISPNVTSSNSAFNFTLSNFSGSSYAVRYEGDDGNDALVSGSVTAALATAPTVSSISQGNEAAQYISCTVNLSDTGSNGTLEYACEEGDSTPDNWQSSSYFPSIVRRGGYVIYARARRVGTNNTATSDTDIDISRGYLLPDTSVNLEPETQTISFSATEATLDFSGGTTGETTQIFRTDDNQNFGTSSTAASFSRDSGTIPATGSTNTYRTKHRRPVSTGGDGSTFYNGNDTVTITREGVTAPTINSITDNNAAAANVTVTVNASGGTGASITYNQSTTATVPSTGWTLTNTFSHPRGTTRYYWASRNQGTSGYVSSTHAVGYLLPDTSVNLEPETQTLAFNATEATLDFSAGTTGETTQIFRTDNGSNFGTSSTAASFSRDSGNIPANGETKTYRTKHRRPTTTGGDGVTFYNGNDTVTITKQAVTVPTINSITDNNAASPNVTVTVNASGGTGGSITYNQTTTATVPSTGWTLSNTFSHPRGTTRYYWASRNQGDSGYVSATHAVGFIAPDSSASISPTSLTISNVATSGSFTVSGLTVGEDVRLFNVGEADTSGQVNGVTSTSVSVDVSSDLPAPGITDTLRVDTRRPTAIGGNNTFVSTGTTATLTREATPAAPTDLTFATSDPQEQTMDVTVTASGGGGSGNYYINRSTQSGFNAMGTDDAFTFNNVFRAIAYTYTAKIITASGSESNNYFESFTVPGQPGVTNITIINVDGQTGTSANLLDTDVDHTVTFSGTTANKDIYYISDSASTLNILGTSSNNTTTTRTISSNDVPAAGSSKTYYLWVIRPTNQYGDNVNYYTGRSYSITRQALTPDAFELGGPINNVPINSGYYESNNITVSGLPYNATNPIYAPVSLSVSSGTASDAQIEIDTNGNFTNAGVARQIENNEEIRIRVKAASSVSTTITGTLTIGTVSDTFSISTAADPGGSSSGDGGTGTFGLRVFDASGAIVLNETDKTARTGGGSTTVTIPANSLTGTATLASSATVVFCVTPLDSFVEADRINFSVSGTTVTATAASTTTTSRSFTVIGFTVG